MIIVITDKGNVVVESIVTQKGHEVYIPEDRHEKVTVRVDNVYNHRVPFGGSIAIYTDNGTLISDNRDSRTDKKDDET